MKMKTDAKLIGVHNMAKVARMAIFLDLNEVVDIKTGLGETIRFQRDEVEGYEFSGRMLSPNYLVWSDIMRFNLAVVREGLEFTQKDGPWSVLTWDQLDDIRRVPLTEGSA